MSTMYIDCSYCGCELGSAHDMVVLKGNGEFIYKAAHRECYDEAHNLQEEEV